MITAQRPHAPAAVAATPPRAVRAVLTLARVEGRRLIRHPAIVIMIVLSIVQLALFLISNDATREHDVGWLLQVAALFIAYAAFLASNLQALKSRRDGAEEMFEAAPLSPARRTVALSLSALWLMALLVVLLVAGDLTIRLAGNGARSDAGETLFPLFDLVQGPAMVGLFVLLGIAVARWLPRATAGLVALVAWFVTSNVIINAAGHPAWFRITPFHPSFLADGGLLAAVHVLYLAGLATVLVTASVLRHGWTRATGAWLATGLGLAGASATFLLVA